MSRQVATKPSEYVAQTQQSAEQTLTSESLLYVPAIPAPGAFWGSCDPHTELATPEAISGLFLFAIHHFLRAGNLEEVSTSLPMSNWLCLKSLVS